MMEPVGHVDGVHEKGVRYFSRKFWREKVTRGL